MQNTVSFIQSTDLLDRFLEPHQARRRAPTQFEDLLADAIERAFAAGHWELPALVASLNASAVQSANGAAWTEDSLAQELSRLSKIGVADTQSPYIAPPVLPPSSMHLVPSDPAQATLVLGLKNLWYPICPSDFVTDKPIALRRLGYKLALWRDANGVPYALEDHCPHRGAPLSRGINLGDRLACPYHGVEVKCDGQVTKVPADPTSSLCGKHGNHGGGKGFHVKDVAGALWLYNGVIDSSNPSEVPALNLPPEIADGDKPGGEWANFMCYVEWRGDYRYVADNVMDPMHGTFLHKQSHSMAEGDINAKFDIRTTEHGYVFEKAGQRDVNFDWTEWADTGTHWMRLAIPYPKTGGPGGSFTIIGGYTPITPELSAVFFWRCRKVSGWQRDVWQFLYRNRLEARHWTVLEQDRLMMEAMEPNANQREHLYAHDAGLVRLRRMMLSAAKN